MSAKISSTPLTLEQIAAVRVYVEEYTNKCVDLMHEMQAKLVAEVYNTEDGMAVRAATPVVTTAQNVVNALLTELVLIEPQLALIILGRLHADNEEALAALATACGGTVIRIGAQSTQPKAATPVEFMSPLIKES